MAASNFLATGATAASSGDFEVAAGTSVTLTLREAGVFAHVEVEKKDSAAGYAHVASLTRSSPVRVMSGVGVYRVRRVPYSNGDATCGVDRD